MHETTSQGVLFRLFRAGGRPGVDLTQGDAQDRRPWALRPDACPSLDCSGPSRPGIHGSGTCDIGNNAKAG
jgi:hypothetical protein